MSGSLLVVLIAARLAVLWGRPLPVSPWLPLAFLWQDLAIVLLFALFERLVHRPWLVRVVYAALLALIVINLPVARVLSSPITVRMLGAARGTLADSFRYHATPANLVLTIGLLVVGIVLPMVWRRRMQLGRNWAVAGALAVLVGPFAAARVDTAGLERNPVIALARTSFPRLRAESGTADWRASIHQRQPADDLSDLRTVAAGQSVLLVVLESTGASYLRPYGALDDPTPNLTRLAAQSIVFDHAYAVYPESVKGLVALLASRFPGFDLDAARHRNLMSPSIATELNAANYETALFHSGRFFYLGMDEVLAGSGFSTLEDAGDIGGNQSSSFGIDESSAVKRILRWIDVVPAGKPFFAAYLPIAGHHPYAYSMPGPFSADQEVGRYKNALHEGDAALGELLEGLRARGLDASTTIIVIGDHGEAFGQHPGNYGHSLALYEENVRVPFLIHGPGIQSRRVQRTVSLLDFSPTVLDLLGLPQPGAFSGMSVLSSQPRMALFFADYSLGLLGLRDGCNKFIYELESGRSKLFDICRDPHETTLIGDRRISAAYERRLRQWSAAELARVLESPQRQGSQSFTGVNAGPR
ncbi:MAG: sulfatase [Gemmatimonadota bacterium]